MSHSNQAKLKRSISLPMLIFYGLGNIFGAGIYVLIGKMAGIAGVYVPLSFLIACVVVFFTALSYAEMSARYPLSAGEAVYINAGFGSPKLSTAVGLLIALSGLLSSAAILHGFHGYLSEFLILHKYAAIAILVTLLSGLAIWGIAQSIAMAALLTLVEIAGLGLVIYVGSVESLTVAKAVQSLTPPLDFSLTHAIMLGAFLAFYAFIGFEDMVNVAEEVTEPTRTMPRAIIITLIITTLFYMAVAIVAVATLPADKLAASSAPLAAVYTAATGNKATILSTIALFAIINGALIQIIMVSRILYGMSRQGWLPKFLASVHPKTRTPVQATIVTGALVFLFALLLPMLTLAQYTSLLIFIIFTLVNASLLIVKRKEPHPEGITTYPTLIPIIAIVLNLIMLTIQIASWFQV